MSTIRIHGPILLLLLAVTFVFFGRLLDTQIHDGVDAAILCDAHALNQDPSAVFSHLGFYFSQPLLEMAFLLEYRAFGLDPTGYIAVNLTIHALNAFVVYMLVNMLFPHGRIALLASLLFALGVGSYGKVFMNIHQLESLLLANLQLLVLYFFIRNDFRRGGQLGSPLFIVGLTLFLMTGLTKTASLSLLSCLLAYKAFFYRVRSRRRILSWDLLVFIAVGVLYYIAQYEWGFRQASVFANLESGTHFTWMSFKNIFRYLNLMFFPMQTSPLLEEAPFWVVWVYEARTVIRVFLALAIISYSFFGFVFGSRAIRFFIAWTYLTLLPFTGLTETGGWLNLNHLYLTSVGFCIILAAGTRGTSNLLVKAGRRRFVPFAVPVVFVMISLGISQELHEQNQRKANQPEAVALRESLRESCDRQDGPDDA